MTEQKITHIAPPGFEAFQGYPDIVATIQQLLALGKQVADSRTAREEHIFRDAFEAQIDAIMDDPSSVLLTDHPAYGVNWLGFLRHQIGVSVGGKSELPLRDSGRGVGDRSGIK